MALWCCGQRLASARRLLSWALRVGAFLLCVSTGACNWSVLATSDTDVSVADSLVASWVDQKLIPGAVLLVAQDGRVLHEAAYGLASVADGVPMTPSTVFDLASVTKVMATTLAMMVLSDRGEVVLDAPVSQYLTDFVGGGRERVTVRDLLTHRSGLPQWVPTYYHASDQDEAYAYIRSLSLMWQVGKERNYSDLGFMLLGLIAEKVASQPLDEFVMSEVYEPLGLKSTAYRRVEVAGGKTMVSAERHVADPRCTDVVFARTSRGNPFERRMVHDPRFGYEIEGDADAWSEWRNWWLDGEVNDGNAFHTFGGVAGHAGLFSTARDLYVLLDLMLSGGEYEGNRLFSSETVANFLGPTGDRQALGWQLPVYAPQGSFGHTGFTGTFVLGVPDRGLALVLLTNRQNFDVDENTEYPDVGPLQRAVTKAVTGVSLTN